MRLTNRTRSTRSDVAMTVDHRVVVNPRQAAQLIDAVATQQ